MNCFRHFAIMPMVNTLSRLRAHLFFAAIFFHRQRGGGRVRSGEKQVTEAVSEWPSTARLVSDSDPLPNACADKLVHSA